jgi:hypothetical protein
MAGRERERDPRYDITRLALQLTLCSNQRIHPDEIVIRAEGRAQSDRGRRRVRLTRGQDGKTANKSKGANAHVAIVRMCVT